MAGQAAAQVRALIAGGHFDTPWHASDEKIFQAALELFAEFGFHGTSTRQIATRAGMSPGALYSHYKSKEDILYRIIRMTHEGMLRQLQLTAARDLGPEERLRDLIACHVRYHAEMYVAARVANYELHCLEPARRKEITELRHLIEMVFRDALRLAESAGRFEIDDLEQTTTLILSLGIDVSRWYRPSHRRSPASLATYYSSSVLRMLGRHEAPVTS